MSGTVDVGCMTDLFAFGCDVGLSRSQHSVCAPQLCKSFPTHEASVKQLVSYVLQ